MSHEALTIIAAIFGGSAASGLASFVGIKIAVTRLEVWREVTAGDVSKHDKRISIQEDDSRVHDTELQLVLKHTGIDRVQRQAQRG